MVEITHYERVMNVTKPWEKESQAFAQRAYSKLEPEKAFAEYLAEERKRIVATQEQGRELIEALTELNGKTVGRLHFMTVEAIRHLKSKGSFPELARNRTFGKVVCASCLTDDLAITNVVGHMHYHMAMHRIAGRKVYDVSPALAEKLRHTELRGLTADDLKLPHPNIYIVVPKEAELEVYNRDSDWHRAIGIYLTEDVDGKGQRCWRFMVCGVPKPIKVMEGVVDDNDALIYFHVSLPAGVPLDTAVAMAHEETFNDLQESKKVCSSGFDKMLDKWKTIFHWGMNVVLYASMEGTDKEEEVANPTAKKLLEELATLPKNSPKHRKVGERLSQMQQLQRTFLGRHAGRPGGWQLTVRVLVTGHWRNQAHGPGRLLRKLIFIEPFWKGPLDGSEVAATTTPVAPVAPETGGSEHEPRNGTGVGGARGEPDAATQQGDRRPDGSGDCRGSGAEQDGAAGAAGSVGGPGGGAVADEGAVGRAP